MRILNVALAVALFAVPAVAQEPEPNEPDRPRVTVGVGTLHSFTVFGGYEPNRMPIGVHGGWRLTDRIGVHGEIVHYRESLGDDPFSGGEHIRTLRWWMAGTTFHFNDRGRLQPHVLAGFEMLVDSDNYCDLLRLDYPDEPCGDFPNRRPGGNVGLGVDIPLGRHFFARVQYVTSVLYVHEAVTISHKARIVAGVGF